MYGSDVAWFAQPAAEGASISYRPRTLPPSTSAGPLPPVRLAAVARTRDPWTARQVRSAPLQAAWGPPDLARVRPSPFLGT